ncbi:MAG: MFS transporter [Rhodospirillaceae bacterium]|nr:MFS transporter [Rhodospirillaceae bacterium]
MAGDAPDEPLDTPEESVTGLAAMRYRDFQLLFFGKVFGWVAVHMVMVSIALQVWEETKDPWNLAFIGLSTFAPAMGFALITGYVADLFDRRRVVAVCYAILLLSSVLFLLLTLRGFTEVWPVFVILAIMGTGRAFYQPASNSLVPNLVPEAIFPNAIAWHTSSNKITQTVGPAIGGLVYELWGPETVYLVSSIGLTIGVITILFIRTKTTREGRQPTTLRVLLAGLVYVYQKKIIFGALILDLFAVLLGGVTILLPVFAIEILEVGPAGAGFLRSAMAAGSLATGLALTLITMDRAVGKILYITVIIYGAATVVFGLSEIYWLSLVAMAVLGAADMVSVYIRVTLIQIATPDDMRGRVSAVNSVFTGASNELGESRAGAMTALIGAVPAVVVGGIGAIVVTLACWKLFPDLTKVERMDRSL